MAKSKPEKSPDQLAKEAAEKLAVKNAKWMQAARKQGEAGEVEKTRTNEAGVVFYKIKNK